MAIITKPFNFGLNDCIGCGKPLKKWNKFKYHNKKCLKRFEKLIDKQVKELA